MRKAIFLLAALFLSYVASVLALADKGSVVVAYLWRRYTVANNSTQAYLPESPLEIGLLVNDTYQTATLVNFTVFVNGEKLGNVRHRLARDESWGTVLQIFLDEPIPPKDTLTVIVVEKVWVTRFKPPENLGYESSGTIQDLPARLVRDYTLPEGVWRYDDPRMKYLADEATKIVGEEKNVLRIVAELVEWIWKKVRYSVGPGPRYPYETLPREKLAAGRGLGDCDDQANLLILMLRRLGVPSYLKTSLVGDFDYGESREYWCAECHYYVSLIGINWGHAWAEVYVPPWGWLPVDLTFHAESNDPLDAIRTSAASEHSKWYTTITLRDNNIYHKDYIEEFRSWIRKIRNSDMFYYYEYMVVREGDSIERLKKYLPPLPLPWKKTTKLEIIAPPESRVFSEAVVRGRVTPPIPNAPIEVVVVKPTGETARKVVYTSEDGTWRLKLNLDTAGLWYVNASLRGSESYLPSHDEWTIFVDKSGSKIEISSEARGSKIIVVGKLDPPLPGEKLDLFLSLPNGTRRKYVVEVGENGLFNYTILADTPGSYNILVSWPGNQNYRHASDSSTVDVKVEAKLKLDRIPQVLDEGRLKISGYLEPGLANRTVKITAVSGLGRSIRAESRTDSHGYFEAYLELEEGRWNITVTFPGEDSYLGASKTIRVDVRYEQPLLLRHPQIYGLLALSLAIAATGIAYKRLRGGGASKE